MKKGILWALMLALLLSLTACGAPAKEPADLNGVYAACQEYLPDMMVLDDTTMLNFLGIHAEDCTQVIAAICAAGLQADEVWLIQAKDQDALNRLTALAQTRQTAKEDETESYLPDQYAIVKEGKILTQGLYLAYLVSPRVDDMQAAFENAVK